jgi:hypothetical protein
MRKVFYAPQSTPTQSPSGFQTCREKIDENNSLTRFSIFIWRWEESSEIQMKASGNETSE